jgi:hypothetical protein
LTGPPSPHQAPPGPPPDPERQGRRRRRRQARRRDGPGPGHRGGEPAGPRRRLTGRPGPRPGHGVAGRGRPSRPRACGRARAGNAKSAPDTAPTGRRPPESARRDPGPRDGGPRVSASLGAQGRAPAPPLPRRRPCWHCSVSHGHAQRDSWPGRRLGLAACGSESSWQQRGMHCTDPARRAE